MTQRRGKRCHNQTVILRDGRREEGEMVIITGSEGEFDIGK